VQAVSLSGAHGFKYGELGRAELNYSSNVKPRSKNKIFVKFRLVKEAGWRADGIDAGEFGRSPTGRRWREMAFRLLFLAAQRKRLPFE
jgi:hypothetical protein